MKKICIFSHFGLNSHHSFLYLFYLERLCLYNREVSLAALLRQNSETNMTKNRGEIMIFQQKKRDRIFLPYCPPLPTTLKHNTV